MEIEEKQRKNNEKFPNLKNFSKGESGNPNGRPKGSKNRSTILKQYMNLKLTRQDPLTGKEKTLPIESFMELEMIAKVLEERDLGTWKEIKDTLYGKNTDKLSINSEIDLSNIVNINVKFDEPKELPD